MTSRSTLHPLLTYLLRAGLGVSAAAAFGCGGNVIVDGSAGGGTGTGTTTTTQTTTSTGNCMPSTLTYEQDSVCVSPGSNGVCLPFDSAELEGLIWDKIDNSGCCESQLAKVLCGPTSSKGGQCCYEVDAYICDYCEGRPFVVGASARVAGVAPRGDWKGELLPDVAGLDHAARAALADAWTASALDEHASVASFARFVLELLSVGAPADIVSATQRALGDEIRHAQRCFALASAYAGHDVGPGPLAIDGAMGRAGLAEIAAATVREGCAGESIAAFEAATARDIATDPAVRAALDEIAQDEAAHAALAFRFVAWAVRQGGAEVRDAVRFELRAMRAPAISERQHEADEAALRAHGRLSAADRRALAERCFAEVIMPCAAALLADHPELPGSPKHAPATA